MAPKPNGGDLTSALQTIASDRLKWPRYVDPRRAFIGAAIVSFIVLYVGDTYAREDRRRHRKQGDLYLKMRWMAIDAATAWLAIEVFKRVYRTLYTWSTIAANRQHYANVHWLNLYRDAIR